MRRAVATRHALAPHLKRARHAPRSRRQYPTAAGRAPTARAEPPDLGVTCSRPSRALQRRISTDERVPTAQRRRAPARSSRRGGCRRSRSSTPVPPASRRSMGWSAGSRRCAWSGRATRRSRPRRRGRRATLARSRAIPFGVKDLFDSEGVRTAYGSPMFDAHVPTRDAEAVRRARARRRDPRRQDADARVRVGHHLRQRAARHRRTTRGRSSGSRAARAAARQSCSRRARCRSRSAATRAARSACRPRSAASSGSSRPTAGSAQRGRGRLPARSIIPGPMATTPADAALLLEALAGVDDADPSTVDVPARRPPGASSTAGSPGSWSARAPTSCSSRSPPDVRDVFDRTLRTLEEPARGSSRSRCRRPSSSFRRSGRSRAPRRSRRTGGGPLPGAARRVRRRRPRPARRGDRGDARAVPAARAPTGSACAPPSRACSARATCCSRPSAPARRCRSARRRSCTKARS